jgi:hypothetical protein
LRRPIGRLFSCVGDTLRDEGILAVLQPCSHVIRSYIHVLLFVASLFNLRAHNALPVYALP